MKQFGAFVRLLGAIIGLACVFIFSQSLAQETATTQQDLTITMGEMFFQLEGQAANETISIEVLKAYRITFVNVGLEVHRVKFGRGLVSERGLPEGYLKQLFDGVSVRIQGLDNSAFRVVTDRLIELDLDPGESLELLFTLPLEQRGEWELGCFVSGHYEAGMKTTLIVK